MRYYMIHYTGMKEVDEKTYLKHTDPEKMRDVIDWYDDGENIFFGGAGLDEKEVIYTILETIGKVDINCCMWGI